MTTTTPSGSASPSGSPGARTTLPDAEAAALATLLAAEQAAVYAYGVVGGQGDDQHREAARAALGLHATRRDLLAGRLSAAGRTPPPPAPAYGLPFAVTSARTARALAAHVEDAVATAEAALVAAARPAARLEASRWLAATALAARRWGGAPTAFPGAPERSAQPRTTS